MTQDKIITLLLAAIALILSLFLTSHVSTAEDYHYPIENNGQ